MEIRDEVMVKSAYELFIFLIAHIHNLQLLNLLQYFHGRMTEQAFSETRETL